MKYATYLVMATALLLAGYFLRGCIQQPGPSADNAIIDSGKKHVPQNVNKENIGSRLVLPPKPDTDTFRDTIYKDTGSRQVIWQYDTIKDKVTLDTLAVIQDYFMKRKGGLSFEDSLLMAKLHYTIWQNNLRDYHFSYEFKQDMIPAGKSRTPTNHAVWGGAYAGGNSNRFTYGLQAQYLNQTKGWGVVAHKAINAPTFLVGPVFPIKRW